MNAPIAIPSPDALPLPAPAWLLHFLLLFTFFLHVVPMAATLGGGFWAVWTARRARSDPAFGDLARRLARWLPYWTAGTISAGVAALLFLQVLYGPVFYASSVVAAVPWLSVVGLVLVGYYGYYFRTQRLEKNPSAAFWVGLAAWLAFAAVAFLYTNQMTLMLHPERHYAMYFERTSGLHLNLDDPTVPSRYLHMLVGSIALAALWVAALGLLAWRRGDDPGRRALQLGGRGFVLATLLQMALGVWFLLSQPPAVRSLFLGGATPATAWLAASVLLAFAAMHFAWWGPSSGEPARYLVTAAACAGGIVVLMLLMRDVVRRETLGGTFDLSALAAAPQWGAIAAFFLLLAAGLAVLGWMLLQLRRARPAASEPPPR